jgi:hypothetical membrane protein
MICRLGAALWLLCFQFFVGEQIARLGWPGHYSMARNYISDLGAVRCDGACSSLHWVMNGSFVLQGLLIVFGTVLVRGFFPSRLVYRIALALLVIAGVGVLEVGVAPEDVNLPLHLLGAVAHFLGGNLAMILLGLVMIRRSVCEALPSRFRSWITFALGSIGLLATIALAFRGTPSWAALGWNTGTVERLAAYPLPLWLTWTGFLILRELGVAAENQNLRG